MTIATNKRIFKFLFFFFCIYFLLFIVSARSNPPPVNTINPAAITEYTLNNGLKLFIKEDHRAPVVVSSVWYKVGSGFEPDGLTGISHVLEHMMFRGSKLFPGNSFKTIIANMGGDQNAMTSNDQTVYFQTLPANKLNIALQLEADRMHQLLISPLDFTNEIQVVMEERRLRIDDDPQGLTWERFIAALHVNNPYHHMTIGWMTDIKNITAQDVKKWYEAWYHPNNVALIIVGDVKPSAVLSAVKHYFASIPQANLPALKPRIEIPTLGPKTVIIETKAALPLLIMGYATPSLITAKEMWQPYALNVLAEILGGSNSSHLAQDLVRKQNIAIQISTSYVPYMLHDNQLVIMAIPASPHTLLELKRSLLEEITALQNTPVTEDELNRIKTQVLAKEVYAKDSLIKQALEIGNVVSIGLPWQVYQDYAHQIEKITPQQVQAVAKQFLTENNLTVAMLKPIVQEKLHREKRIAN